MAPFFLTNKKFGGSPAFGRMRKTGTEDFFDLKKTVPFVFAAQ